MGIWRERIRGMSVAWFSFNLATSAVVLASYALGHTAHLQALETLAHVMAYMNTVVYLVIAAAFLAKLSMVRGEFLRQLKHPVKGPFVTAISIATMLLALDWGVVLGYPKVAALFFYVGTVLHTFFFIAIIYGFIMHERIEVHAMHPGWYMPAVGNVLVPYIGGLLASEGIWAPRSLLGIYLGTGVVFWLALFTIWLYRSIFHHPPPARLLAATWINLAPPAVAPMAYESLLSLGPRAYHEAMKALSAQPVVARYLGAFFDMFYYTFWGAAGLLLAIILVLTAVYIRRRQMEFAESWWAFVFPVAAYSISTIHLYLHHTAETWLLYYAAGLYALTWLFYTVTTAFSIYYGYMEWFKGKKPEELPTPAKPLPEEVAREQGSE